MTTAWSSGVGATYQVVISDREHFSDALVAAEERAKEVIDALRYEQNRSVEEPVLHYVGMQVQLEGWEHREPAKVRQFAFELRYRDYGAR